MGKKSWSSNENLAEMQKNGNRCFLDMINSFLSN